jgi:hypothetical protein
MFSGHFIIPSKAKYYLLAFHLLLRPKKSKQNILTKLRGLPYRPIYPPLPFKKKNPS